MAVLLGTLLGIPFWLLGLFRIIRISGYWRAVDYVRRGRVLIVANHPSLIETFLIPLVFWPWAMFRLRMFPWSLPDKNLFKGFTPEHHERLRCIRVGRDDTLESRKLNWSAMKRVMEHFERQQCFVAHLEGGRTSKQAEHVSVGPNKMGKIKNAQILKAAWKKDAWIMPLHVKMTDAMRQDLPGFGEVSAAPAPQSKMLADQARVSPSLQDRRTEVRRRNRKETSGIGDSHTRDAGMTCRPGGEADRSAEPGRARSPCRISL